MTRWTVFDANSLRRHALGIASVILLLLALGLWWRWPQDSAAAVAICVRAGLVLGAIWLALPQLSRLIAAVPVWMVFACGISALVLIARPRTIVFIGPALGSALLLHFLGWFLRQPPKRKSGSTRRQRPPEKKKP